jgi:hypothetical protein
VTGACQTRGYRLSCVGEAVFEPWEIEELHDVT